MAPGDRFADPLNAAEKYVVSRTLTKPTWRNTTIIRDDVIESVRVLPGGVHATFGLKSATPYASGVVGLRYERQRRSQ